MDITITKLIKMKNFKTTELSFEEMKNTNGGLVIELIGLYCALFAIGYQMGKDAKERAH
jgi:hypothetical protein